MGFYCISYSFTFSVGGLESQKITRDFFSFYLLEPDSCVLFVTLFTRTFHLIVLYTYVLRDLLSSIFVSTLASATTIRRSFRTVDISWGKNQATSLHVPRHSSGTSLGKQKRRETSEVSTAEPYPSVFRRFLSAVLNQGCAVGLGWFFRRSR